MVLIFTTKHLLPFPVFIVSASLSSDALRALGLVALARSQDQKRLAGGQALGEEGRRSFPRTACRRQPRFGLLRNRKSWLRRRPKRGWAAPRPYGERTEALPWLNSPKKGRAARGEQRRARPGRAGSRGGDWWSEAAEQRWRRRGSDTGAEWGGGRRGRPCAASRACGVIAALRRRRGCFSRRRRVLFGYQPQEGPRFVPRTAWAQPNRASPFLTTTLYRLPRTVKGRSPSGRPYGNEPTPFHPRGPARRRGAFDLESAKRDKPESAKRPRSGVQKKRLNTRAGFTVGD
ncbi:hypothetical protein SUDANB95_00225 [Actinosynnema sp. ALI-1.44]